MSKFTAWLRQPTTVAGISALVGTVIALLMHQISSAAAIPLLTGAVVSALMPDNSGAQADAHSLAVAVAAGVTAGKIDPLALAPEFAAVIGDIQAIATKKGA